MTLKKINIILTALLLVLACQAYASSSLKQEKSLCEITNIEQGIAQDSITVSGIPFGASISQAKKVLGEPEKIEKDINEFNGDVNIGFNYGGARLFFVVTKLSSRLESFWITDSTVSVEPFNIRVGQSIKACPALYDLSQDKLSKGKGEPSGGVALAINIKSGDEDNFYYLDERLIISVDDAGVVSEIDYWINW